MKPVVVDTNVILLPFTQGSDIESSFQQVFGEYEIVVPTSVISELQKLSENGGAVGRAAKGALKLSERYRKEKTGKMGDDGILEIARKLKAAVATNDKVLQLECVKSGLQVLVARENGRLALRRAGSGKS
jgi:rRNA-processing protein FCF1